MRQHTTVSIPSDLHEAFKKLKDRNGKPYNLSAIVTETLRNLVELRGTGHAGQVNKELINLRSMRHRYTEYRQFEREAYTGFETMMDEYYLDIITDDRKPVDKFEQDLITARDGLRAGAYVEVVTNSMNESFKSDMATEVIQWIKDRIEEVKNDGKDN